MNTGTISSTSASGKTSTQSTSTAKTGYLKWIAWAAGGIVSLIALLMLTYCVRMLLFDHKGNINYVAIAIAILVTWFTVLLIYFSWAIYFYNVNLGLTNDEWEQIQNQDGYDPKTHTPSNPHKNETLGLPNGTVRGTIALTLLVCGIALMIFGFDKDYAKVLATPSQFDFFITAFQMMIAFYFGNKALDVFKDKPQDSSAQPITPSPALETEPTTNQATNGNSGNASSADAVVSVGG